MTSTAAAGWSTKVRRRDGRLVTFDVRRIETAVARAAREAGHTDANLAVTVARAVADGLARRPRGRVVTVEEIQDLVEAQLSAAGFDDVARAYIIYRQGRAELRSAKALLGVRDELKLSLAAVTVLSERYLLRDERGRPVESTGELMDRSANFVAEAEDQYRAGSSAQWADQFSALLRGLEFLPNSPTLMNAGTPVGLLSACVVLPVEDSLRSIFTTLGHAAEIRQAGGGTGYTFSHLRPAGDRVAGTGGTASGPGASVPGRDQQGEPVAGPRPHRNDESVRGSSVAALRVLQSGLGQLGPDVQRRAHRLGPAWRGRGVGGALPRRRHRCQRLPVSRTRAGQPGHPQDRAGHDGLGGTACHAGHSVR